MRNGRVGREWREDLTPVGSRYAQYGTRVATGMASGKLRDRLPVSSEAGGDDV